MRYLFFKKEKAIATRLKTELFDIPDGFGFQNAIAVESSTQRKRPSADSRRKLPRKFLSADLQLIKSQD